MAATKGIPVPAKTVSPSRICRADSMIISSSDLTVSAIFLPLQKLEIHRRVREKRRVSFISFAHLFWFVLLFFLWTL
jgi:hypothetical protein